MANRLQSVTAVEPRVKTLVVVPKRPKIERGMDSFPRRIGHPPDRWWFVQRVNLGPFSFSVSVLAHATQRQWISESPKTNNYLSLLYAHGTIPRVGSSKDGKVLVSIDQGCHTVCCKFLTSIFSWNKAKRIKTKVVIKNIFVMLRFDTESVMKASVIEEPRIGTLETIWSLPHCTMTTSRY